MKETKPHGNRGNKSAAKPADKRKDSVVYARCLTTQKNEIINFSKSKGMKPQEWIIETLMKAIKAG